jgi:glycogen debranching enzyme
MNRRSWLRATAAALSVANEAALAEAETAPLPLPASLPPGGDEKALIYRLLGFATMTGEDPLRMWARLKETKTWLAGPLSPDCWCGQTFIADHIDIFAFRFLSIPAAWMAVAHSDNRAAYAAANLPRWLADWPAWWRTVGPKAPDDSYARLIWQMPDGGPEVTYEWARTGKNEIVGRVTNSVPSDLVLQAYVPWDGDPPEFSVLYSTSSDRTFLRGRSWIPGTRDGMRWILALSAPIEESVGVGTARWHGYLRQINSLYFCAKQGQTYSTLEAAANSRLDSRVIDQLLETNRRSYQQSRPHGEGWLADVPAAVNDQLQWSEVYTPERRHAYLTVSRHWARSNNSAPDFLWDSFLSALLVTQEDKRKAFDLVRDITSWQTAAGMFCQYGQWPSHPETQIFPVAWGHTQYPIGALAVSKLYCRHPDKEFLADIYPRLLKSHHWWFADRGDGQPWRDGNKDGLLELGSNYPEEIPYEDRQQVAYFESHDDSPEWWHVAPYNEKTNTCELATVERNCLYAMDAWVLAWMARELGRPREAQTLEREHAAMAQRINELLWDPAGNCYFNRRWSQQNGSWFNPQMAPDIFFSLLGKVAPSDRAETLRSLFHDPKKFAGEWILPTISRDDPMYPRQDYWRGKVWGPINWLVYQGFKIHEWDREACLLAESSAKMFLKPWREKGECHENFLSTTGEGSSDPHYTWGALMVLIALEEYIDANPWHGLKFGCLEPVEEGWIRQYPVQNALYDVGMSSKSLEVRRNGRLLFASNVPLEIRQVIFDGRAVSCEIRSKTSARVHIGNAAARQLGPGTEKLSGAFSTDS